MGLKNRHFLTLDIIVFLLTPTLAIILRMDNALIYLQKYQQQIWEATLIFLAIKISVFYTCGIYKRYWRHAGYDEFEQLAWLTVIVVLVQTVLFNVIHDLVFLHLAHLPRSLPIIDGMLSLFIAGGIRFSVPVLGRISKRKQKFYRRDRLLIIGAGNAGISLAKKMQQSPWLGLNPVAFIDDDPRKLNLTICRLPIIGNRYSIPEIVSSLHVRRVIIAMPTAPVK